MAYYPPPDPVEHPGTWPPPPPPQPPQQQQLGFGESSSLAVDPAVPSGWAAPTASPVQLPRTKPQQQQQPVSVGPATATSRPKGAISFEGCIVCRLRKKKCDQRHPGCDTCKRLNIECLGYQKKRPEFLRDKSIAQQVRTDLTAFLSRTGKMPNRGRGPNSTSAAEPTPVEDLDETFEFALYEAMYQASTVAAAAAAEPFAPKPIDREPQTTSVIRTRKAPARPSATALPQPTAQDQAAHDVSFLSTSSSSTLSASTISSLPSGQVAPSWHGSVETVAAPPPVALPPATYPSESAYTRVPVSFVDPPSVGPWPSQPELPMGANVQYGPFATPQWQTDALVAALRSPDKVPRPLDSPLLRLDLPVEQYELIQIYVTFIDVYASIAVSDQELLQHNKLHHQLDDSDARCDCVDEALVGKTVTYRALRDKTFIDSACALASKFREKKLLSTAQADIVALSGGRTAIAPWISPERNDESEAYRHKAYTMLVSGLHSEGVDILTALFTCQRLIWTSVYDGGINGWQQPLVAMRWCLESLFSTLHNRGVNIVDVERIDQRILFLLRRVVTIDIAACISQESSTPLYPFYQALLTSPHFHLSTGSDLLSHVSSSNIICRIFLEGSVLKAWKRASGPAVDPLELAARAAPIQALIDTLLGGSFEESLKMFGYDYFSSPFRTMNFLCCQICAQASQIYLSAIVHGHDPTHPAIATAVSGIIDLVSILPTKLCLPAIVFPLLLGSLYAMPVDRPWFVDMMSPETLGAESAVMGNVGPMRLLRDETWRRQDDWEARGRHQGVDRVDWLLLMRRMRMEILLM